MEKWLLERRGKDVLLVFDEADEAKDLLSENAQCVLNNQRSNDNTIGGLWF